MKGTTARNKREVLEALAEECKRAGYSMTWTKLTVTLSNDNATLSIPNGDINHIDQIERKIRNHIHMTPELLKQLQKEGELFGYTVGLVPHRRLTVKPEGVKGDAYNVGYSYTPTAAGVAEVRRVMQNDLVRNPGGRK